jgi:Dihydrodipicolinate synthetase family
MGHTSEDRMCCNRGAVTAQYMVSPPRMKNPFGLATLTGYASALPTPFKGESIDEEAFARFCEWQIGQGISSLVVAGTTGEAPTLSMVEHRRLVRIAAETADGRVPVVAGTGANATGPSSLPGKPSRKAPTVCSSSPLITIARRSRGFIGISGRSTMRPGCRSCFMTCPRARHVPSRPRRSCVWPNCPGSSVSRMRPAISRGRCSCAGSSGSASGCSPKMTPLPWSFSPPEATVASPLSPT